MKILVTGATGFLGRRLVDALAPRHELRLLVRGAGAPGRTAADFAGVVPPFHGVAPSSHGVPPPGDSVAPPAGSVPPPSSHGAAPSSIEVWEGDVTDAAGVRRAAAGCDAVVHAAALVKILAPAADFDRVNVGGLENVLTAAEAAGVSRLLYVSSFMALGPSERGPGGLLDEAAGGEAPAGEPGERRWINDYERTKTLADRLARRAIAAGQPVSVVYPAVIYGPGEMTEGNIVVRHLLDLLHRRLPALLGTPGRRWSYVYVEDVVGGIVQALENGRPGGRWVLGGDNVNLGDFYAVIEELSGVPVPRRRMPDGVAKAIGAVQREWARLRGTTPALTPDLVEVYRHDWAYSSARAETDLGYVHRPLRAGLRATLDWLRESGQWRQR